MASTTAAVTSGMETFSLGLADGRRFEVVYNPARWAIQDGVLYRVLPSGANGSTTLEVVSLAVPVILGRRVDLETGRDTGRVQLAAYGMLNGSYRTWTFDVSASVLLDANALPKVLPTKEVYASDGVAMKMWLSDQIRHNDIAKWSVSTHCGWYEAGGVVTFVAPGWQVGPEIAHDESRVEDYKAAGLHRPSLEGDLDTWWSHVAEKKMSRFPLFGMTLGAAVGAVVGARLGDTCVSYTLELVAERQTGKTALARVVQSFFGRPGKKGIELSMNATKVGVNLLLTYLYCLPMFADDETAVAAGERDASAGYLAYNVFNGATRIHGDAEQRLHQGGTWQTVAIVTSEAPMLRDEKRGGAQARCFTVQKHPFATWDSERGDFGAPPENPVDGIIEPLAKFTSACWGHGLYQLVTALREVDVAVVADAYDTILHRVVKRLRGHSLDYTTAREISVALLGLWALEHVLKLPMGDVASSQVVEDAMVKVAWEREEAGGVKSPGQVAWASFLEWAPQQMVTGRIVAKGEGPSPFARNEVWGVWDVTGGAAGSGDDAHGEGPHGEGDMVAWLNAAIARAEATSGVTIGDLFVTIYGLDAFLFRTKMPLSRGQLVEAWGKLGLIEPRGTEKKTTTRYPDAWARMGALPKTTHRVLGYVIRGEKMVRE